MSTEPLEHSGGTVVRSEDFGRVWYVNGRRAAAGCSEGVWDLFHAKTAPTRENYTESVTWYRPLISVDGDFEVSAVVFDT